MMCNEWDCKQSIKDLDLSGDIANTSLNNFSGKIDEHNIRGKLNGGGVPVTVATNAGRIKLEIK